MYSWYTSFLLSCLLLGSPAHATDGPVLAQELSSQQHIDHREMVISDEDWRWLRHKTELKIGLDRSEGPPFNVHNDDKLYEGIGADVTALVAQLLGMRVKVVVFDTHEQAMQALETGAIDLFGNHGSDVHPHDVIFSKPFARDRLALFKRSDEARKSSSDLAGMRVSVAAEHSAQLQERFPRARFMVYANHDAALAATAFGPADLYLDDVLSAYYRINRSFHGFVKFERFADFSVGGYGYAMRADNQQLQRVVNAAIDGIGEERLNSLAKRWVGNGVLPTEDKVALTAEEQRWISRHPVVRLQINDDLAPLAFFNANGVFAGVAADVLEVITQRTGLHFQVQARSGGFLQQIDALQNSEADMVIMTPSPTREETMRFSRPFLSSAFVLVGPLNAQGKVDPLGDLAGKRLAIPLGHLAWQHTHLLFPQAKLIEASTSLDAMNMVYRGKADASIVSLPSSRYYIVRFFEQTLAIAGLVDIGAATGNFAVRRGDPELQTILDKALQSIAPDELNAIANRWRSPPGMSGETWRDYQQVITQIILGAAAVLLLALVWVVYLRRQIKARRKAEQMLNDQLQFVETLTDSMIPPLYVRDLDGRMVSCNRSYLASVGLNAEQVVNKTVNELPKEHFETIPDFHSNYLRAMEQGQSIESVHAVTLQGRQVWIDHWIQPYQDSQGVTRGVICGWLDITEHRHLVQQLKEAKNLAIEASRAKTSFLATMSHEIRTPMNAVIGVLELALKRSNTERIERSSIEIAYTSAKSLLELIGDILDIARIESGRLSLSPKRANLREQVESVARVFEGLARQKRLNLVLDIDSSINCDVLVDALRFKQVLSNLVSNAIKFTDDGFVRISIAGTAEQPSLLNVNFSVEDSGVGISAVEQQRLFQPFSQVRRNVEHTEGTGLGLVICRSLCEMMGGQVSLVSAPGRGTRVEVQLRLQVLDRVAISEPEHTLTQAQHYRLQVLVVDDHQVNRQVLNQQLSFLGHDVSEAKNGLEALSLWREQAFDIIITDCHMPLMTGAELTGAIRQIERDTAQEPTVILGLTADAQPEELEHCILAGMNDCLIKPIGLDELQARLQAYQQSEAQDVFETARLTQVTFEQADLSQLFDLGPLRILISTEPVKFHQILNELISNNRKDLESLDALVQAREFTRIAELTHRIKGAARVVKGEQLVQCCRQLEEACQDTQVTSEQIRTRAHSLEQAVQALEQALLALMRE